MRFTPASNLELKSLTNAGEFRGLASDFLDQPDHQGDRIGRGAFAKSLEAHRRAGTEVAMLWSHNPARPIGRWKSLRESDLGLEAIGTLALETAEGGEAHKHLLAKTTTGLSIGFSVGEDDFGPKGRIWKEIELLEISVVTLPANSRARIESVKDMSRADFVQFAKSRLGLSNRDAKKLAGGGYSALTGKLSREETDQLDAEIQRQAKFIQSLRY